jgi:hypothetical protein
MATPTTLPASFVAGNILEAAQLNDLRGAFRVLQVVSFNTTASSSGTTISTATYTATGLTATITPQSATSNILIFVNQANRKTNANAATEVQSRLYRGASPVTTANTVSTCYTNTAMELRAQGSLMYLDNPATTSATTYTMYGSNSGAGTVSFDFFSSSSMVLMEISA